MALNGYQVSVLDDSTVYQYSENDGWVLFITNRPVELATKKALGIVQVGDGIKVEDDGLISLEVPKVEYDWSINDTTKPGYIKDRTHYDADPISWNIVDLVNSVYENDSLYNMDENAFAGYETTGFKKSDHGSSSTYHEISTFIKVSNDAQSFWDYVDSVRKQYKKDGKTYVSLKAAIGGFKSDGTLEWHNYTISDLYRRGDYWLADQNQTSGNFALLVGGVGTYIAIVTDLTESWSAQGHKFTSTGVYAYMSLEYAEAGEYEPKPEGFKYYRCYAATFDSGAFTKRLEKKYLPDDVADMEWVLSQDTNTAQSDWNEEDTTELSYIKNKPRKTYRKIDIKIDRKKTASKMKSGYRGLGGYNFYGYLDKDITLEDVNNMVGTWGVSTTSGDTLNFDYSDGTSVNAKDDSLFNRVWRPSESGYEDRISILSKHDDTTSEVYGFGFARNFEFADGTTSPAGRVGFFMRNSHSSTYPDIDRVYSSIVYEKNAFDFGDNSFDFGWTGTERLYEDSYGSIKDEKKIFITDDVTTNAKLNGGTLDNANFYAPTTAGTSGQMFTANGWLPIQFCAATAKLNEVVLAMNSTTSYNNSYHNFEFSGSNTVTVHSSILDYSPTYGFKVMRAGYYFVHMDMITYRSSTSGWTYIKGGANFPPTFLDSYSSDGEKIVGFYYNGLAWCNEGDYIQPQWAHSSDCHLRIRRPSMFILYCK